MPELPEVEIVRRKLEELILHKTIVKIEVYVPSMIRTEVPKSFKVRQKTRKSQVFPAGGSI